MTYSGEIKFITETNARAIVAEIPAGSIEFEAHRLINSDFSGKIVGDSISYNYDSYDAENNGRDITLV